MIRRMTVLAFALTCIPFASAIADEVGSDEVIMIEKDTATPVPAPAGCCEQPVSAPPPPWVEMQSTAIAAGLGARFGEGVLLVAGVEHPFVVRGMSVGDLGISRISAEGGVANLENVEDFAGHYVAVEAGAAAGKGRSALTMRNGNGVVITLESELEGLQLTLGASGLDIELR